MSRADLYIVAAGNGSRLKADVPKALVPIVGEPCLTTTLQQIGQKFRKVFVVTNVAVQAQWLAYFRALESSYSELARLVVNVPIHSGLGDGHATLQAIIAAEKLEGSRLAQDIVVAWGDVFFQYDEIIDELLALAPIGAGFAPAVYEGSPYVSLSVNDAMQCLSAEFSKFGEKNAAGFHDQSVFRFHLPRLKKSLEDLHNALFKNGRYIASGAELSLLYSFHHLYNTADPVYVYETRYPTLSFNTVDEVADIQIKIRARWKRQRRSERPGSDSAGMPAEFSLHEPGEEESALPVPCYERSFE
jgi:molybdopterin-guanine dinucleotide biosynthesis protein A